MTNLTYAQKLSFAQTVAQLIRDSTTELQNGGFDPAIKLLELENSLKLAVELDAQQEAMKAKLVESTEKAVSALNATYLQTSSLIDAMVGVLGKDTPLAKRLRQLRDQMANESARGKRTPAET